MGETMPRVLGAAAVLAALAVVLPTAAVAAAGERGGGGDGGGGGGGGGKYDWKLVHAEDFSRFKPAGDTGWKPDKDGPGSPYDVDGYDNDGEYFKTIGGEAFEEHLAGIDLYRRSFEFGKGGWLTAELATRDKGEGVGKGGPSFSRKVLDGAGPAGYFDNPGHNDAVVVRSTDELPAEYRVEVTLKTIDFGGQRNGEWDYDGKVNGYQPTGCTTNFPWGASGDFTPEECDWFDITKDSNGFYFLSIMDYARPAPHNNVFIHNHRKVVMDGYNRYKYTGNGLRYCDAESGELQPYEWGSGNGVNMIFMNKDRRYANQPGTEYVMHSECGTEVGGGIVSQADLMPEMMPEQSYEFAVERRSDSYVLELKGEFRHVGERTLRYEQEFDDGVNPLWHHNRKAGDYNGEHNADWTYPSPNGTYVDEDVWPKGSAYPDYFLIGQPHMNFYEGSAHIDDIRMYVPGKR
ncbi:hypothetical protein CLV63_12568 [Murinocardiopsis flavida]|uniref:Uncharacterized protein n=1 Tax=Murinocardiopsis flavida TaxID=645275 RepID=A0A2P8CXH0_9ACTN|nr:hypothetical protein [Murinocardiopsis flavida]PSK89674.1 hypothetical protein CLV63_12568 [Murinocardiopsis flavida]